MKDDEKVIEEMLENLDPSSSTTPEELKKWQEKHRMISRILDKIKIE